MDRKKKISNIILIIIIVLLIIIFSVFLFFYNTELHDDTKDKFNNSVFKDYTLVGKSSINNYVSYTLYPVDNEEDILNLSANQFEIPEYLFKYSNFIFIRVFFGNNSSVENIKIVSQASNEVIEDISEENLKQAIGYPDEDSAIYMDWTETVYLADLLPNTVYIYTADHDTTTPIDIINNLGENCMIYEKDEEMYEINVMPSDDLSSSYSFSSSYKEIDKGDTFTFMYRVITSEEFVDSVDEDSIIFLSKYENGDALDFQFEDYIYNDTDYDITLVLEENFVGDSITERKEVIPAGKIYDFNWGNDPITIQY